MQNPPDGTKGYGRIPQHKIEEVRDRVSITDVIRGHVALKRKGRDLWGCCPFHQEKSPSFQVKEAEGYYHCFGCGAHGNAFDFVMQMQGLPFPEAVERLANQAGVIIEREKVNPVLQKKRTDGLSALERATVWFERGLKGEAKDYLFKRGLVAQTLKKFRLGYAPEGWRNLKDSLQQEGFSEAVLKETALVRQGERGGEPYDTFRARLMFPIENMQGKVVAFGGRVFDGSEPKYLNSPQTPFFNKSHLLYGLYHAAPHIRRQQQALLVEGYMDVIALHQAGVQTAVAPMGTAVTEDQIALLWRYYENPTVCLDGDDAGRNAALKLAWRVLPILKPGKTLSFCMLPQKHDPDSFIQEQGVAAFESLLTKKQTLEDVLWLDVCQGLDIHTGAGRAAIEQKIEELTKTLTDPTLKTHWRGAFKDRLWQKIKAKRFKKTYKNVEKNIISDVTAGGVAQTLLAIVLYKPEVLAYIGEAFSQIVYEHPLHVRLQEKLFSLLGGNGVEITSWNAYLSSTGLEDDVKILCRKSGVHKLLEEEKTAGSVDQIAVFWRKLFVDYQRTQRKKNLSASLLKEVGQGITTDLDAWQKFKSAKVKGVVEKSSE